MLRLGPGKYTKVPGQAPHITTDHSADIRNRTSLARVTLRIRKPKLETRVKDWTVIIHQQVRMFSNAIQNNEWGRAVEVTMLPPSPTNPITIPKRRDLSGKVTLSHDIIREKIELHEDRTYDYALNSRSSFWDATVFLKNLSAFAIWNSILPEPGRPSSQFSPNSYTYTPHCMQEDPDYNEPVV